jgi:hypothetical protein
MDIEDKFPGMLDEKELIKLGGKRIDKMSYYELEINNKKGFYEPNYGRDHKIKYYSLRRVVKK